MELIGLSTISAIVIGLVAVAKKLGVNQKYAPILAVMFGLIFSLMMYFIQDIKLLTAIMGGIVIGLTAVGFYSSVKNVKEGILNE